MYNVSVTLIDFRSITYQHECWTFIRAKAQTTTHIDHCWRWKCHWRDSEKQQDVPVQISNYGCIGRRGSCQPYKGTAQINPRVMVIQIVLVGYCEKEEQCFVLRDLRVTGQWIQFRCRLMWKLQILLSSQCSETASALSSSRCLWDDTRPTPRLFSLPPKEMLRSWDATRTNLDGTRILPSPYPKDYISRQNKKQRHVVDGRCLLL